MGLAAFARRRAADHLGAVVDRGLRMEGAVLAGEALADDLGVLVDQDGHQAEPFTAFTIFCAASSRSSAEVTLRFDLAMISLPFSTLVPSSRTTSGTLQADFLHRRHHAFGDDVALHDAAEDVDQDALHVRVGGDDLERRGHLLGGGAAADIEEVRRRHAVELDDVHRGHREAGAVHHAADLAVERDVVEVVFRRLDFLLVFFGLVAQRRDVGMAEQRVVVEADLGVEADQLLVLGDDQRIDLQQRHVGLDEGLVEIGRAAGSSALQIARRGRAPWRGAAHDAGRCSPPDRP